jgi:hypothetical protein
MKSWASASLLAAVVIFISAVPGLAQQGGGHGAIYYSPSAHRIGWAKNLPSDQNADNAAFAFCRGGTMDALTNQEFSEQRAGASATAAGPPLATVVSDCSRVIKFDSSSDHRCAGFGFSRNAVSRGVRDRDRAAVERDLASSWGSAFVACNDNGPVIGVESLGARAVPVATAGAPVSGTTTVCNSIVTPGRVLTWTSFNQDGSQHATGTMSITKVSGSYFDAIQTAAGGGGGQFYGMIYNTFAGFINPKNEEAWVGNCSPGRISGTVKGYTFSMTSQ